MRIPLLLIWLPALYCQKNATDTITKNAAPSDIVINIVKMTRDSPLPVVAYNQGSLTPPFPAVSRIRSKTKLASSDLTPSAGTDRGVGSGQNGDLHRLVSSLEHSKSNNGAFSRKATKTGSAYGSYPFLSEQTGEPYLSGYRGVPETQGITSSGPNYMGALTRTNKAGKHTFGSYGSIDSEKAQMWQSQAVGSSSGGYGRSGTYGNNMDYSSGHSLPTTGYGSSEPAYSSSNPYSASYQGGSDNSYGTLGRYSNNDYSNYGSQVASGMNSQWNGQAYQPQSYSSLPTQGYDNFGWQPYSTQESSWPQQSYQTAESDYTQNSGYGNMQVEQMPSSAYSDYQYPSSSYSTPKVKAGSTGGSYSAGNGADYSQANQQNYNYGSYMNTDAQTSYTGSSNQVPSYTYSSSYGTPTSSGSDYSTDNGYLQQGNYGSTSNNGYVQQGNYGSSNNGYAQQGNYGSNNNWNQYGSSDSSGYQTTYQPSWNYGSSDIQSGGYDYYKPAQEYSTAQNYGNTGYQTSAYNPSQTTGNYGNSYGANYNYNNDYQQGQYSNYGGGPQMEFTMNVGYGSSRASKGTKGKQSLTNNAALSRLDEDGYRITAK